MKNMIRGAIASLILFVTCLAHGGVPAVNVTVSDASGKAAFKGATDAKGTFATNRLKAGNYTVQFNSELARRAIRTRLSSPQAKRKFRPPELPVRSSAEAAWP